MAIYGTYTTVDTPKEYDQKIKAFDYLSAKIDNIGGSVYQKLNPHEFGHYLTFEIDLPDELEGIDTDHDLDECDGNECRLCDLDNRYYHWTRQADKVIKEYNSIFNI